MLVLTSGGARTPEQADLTELVARITAEAGACRLDADSRQRHLAALARLRALGMAEITDLPTQAVVAETLGRALFCRAAAEELYQEWASLPDRPAGTGPADDVGRTIGALLEPCQPVTASRAPAGPESAAAFALWHGFEALGSAIGALDDAVVHSRRREQFGTPIGVNQAISHRCARLYVDLELAAALGEFGASAQDVTTSAGLEAVAGFSLLAGDVAIRTAEACLHMNGATGFCWEHDAHLRLRRAWTLRALLRRGTSDEASFLLAHYADITELSGESLWQCQSDRRSST
ncbi:MAG: acyl-CoA dehydrogenase family protein [Streptosporangiaceae bacterium]|jgi:hypothetical protein